MAPGKLVTTGNMAENWKLWKQMWSNYMVTARLDTQLPAYKVALFLHCIGVDALKIYNGFQIDSPEDRNDLANIIQKFSEFTIGELNETFERYTFNSRNQQENESIDVYVTTHWQFGNEACLPLCFSLFFRGGGEGMAISCLRREI